MSRINGWWLLLLIWPNLSWAEILQETRTGQIDVLPCVGVTPERSRFLRFAKPYLSFPMVIVTRDDALFVNGVQDFASGRLAGTASVWPLSR